MHMHVQLQRVQLLVLWKETFVTFTYHIVNQSFARTCAVSSCFLTFSLALSRFCRLATELVSSDTADWRSDRSCGHWEGH